MTGEVYGKLEPCENCGRLKSEYVDYGTYGKYRCWWCEERAGNGLFDQWFGTGGAAHNHAEIEGVYAGSTLRISSGWSQDR